MRFELKDEPRTLSVGEVVERLISGGAVTIADDEAIGDIRLDCTELELDVMHYDLTDRRTHGTIARHVSMSPWDIRRAFDEAEYVAWADDENGDPVLLVFGC